MGASNFGKLHNASRYYTWEEPVDTYSIEAIIIEQIKHLGKKKGFDFYKFEGLDTSPFTHTNVVPDNVILYDSIEVEWGQTSLVFYVLIYLENGYYEGMRVDFKFYVVTNAWCYRDVESEDLFDYCVGALENAYEPHMIPLFESRFYNKVHKELDQVSEDINNILEQVCDNKVVQVGNHASNGETMFKYVD